MLPGLFIVTCTKAQDKMTPKSKVCPCCKIEKSRDGFNRHKNRKDGLHIYCKECRKERRKANAAEKREYNQKYYYANQKQILEQKKEYHKNNPHIIFNASSKRRKLIGDCNITKEEWLIIMRSTEWKCFYCGCALNKHNQTIDHWVPLARGGDHNVTNLVPACKTCNCSKGSKLYREWV